jgi:hypothetical protein
MTQMTLYFLSSILSFIKLYIIMHIRLYLSNKFSKLNKIKLNYTYIFEKSVGTRSWGGVKEGEELFAKERRIIRGNFA